MAQQVWRPPARAMIELEPTAAVAYAASLLEAAGASSDNAGLVARHLVASDERGVHSHGLLRIPQYADELARGEIDGRAVPVLSRRGDGWIVVDGRGAFGQVSGQQAVDAAASAAKRLGLGLATVTRSGHAGRIGAYTEALVECGCLGVAFCSGPRSGHRVAPFGGIEGRLSTNPISFAFATGDGPVVADFSTSVVPEGVVRRLRDLGSRTPDGALQDAAGRPTTDPHVLYADPPGTILPLGGAAFGHKGYALGLLVEAMTTVLCGEDPSDPSRAGNNLTVLAIALDEGSLASAAALGAYVRETRPASADRPVLLPGDPERKALDSGRLLVDSEVWSSLERLAERLGVAPLEVGEE